MFVFGMLGYLEVLPLGIVGFFVCCDKF
jgi:hypothetical protein